MTIRVEPGLAAARQRLRPVLADIAEGAAERDRERTLPVAEVERLRDAGIGLLRVPAAHGGFGLTLRETAAVLVEVAAADANLPQVFRGHLAIVEDLRALPAEVAEPWWERFAAGEFFGNAWSETGQAAVGSQETRVSRDPAGGWRLDGRKYYTTGSVFADWIDVTATDEDGRDVVVLLDRRAPGVEVRDDWNGFGQRGTGTGTATFRRAPVPDAHVRAFSGRFTYQTGLYQLVLLAVLGGVARRLHDDVRDALRTRSRVYSHGNADLAREDPQLLAVVGRLRAAAFQADALVAQAAAALDEAADREHERGSDAHRALQVEAELATASAQVVLAEAVPRAATEAFDALGASATDRELGLDRHWRNARTVASHNPVLFKARGLGAHSVNGTEPELVWAIGRSRRVAAEV